MSPQKRPLSSNPCLTDTEFSEIFGRARNSSGESPPGSTSLRVVDDTSSCPYYDWKKFIQAQVQLLDAKILRHSETDSEKRKAVALPAYERSLKLLEEVSKSKLCVEEEEGLLRVTEEGLLNSFGRAIADILEEDSK